MSDPAEAAVLAALAKTVQAARGKYQAAGMRNVFGLTPEQKAEADLDYERATQEWMRAEAAYREALRRIAGAGVED